MKEFTKFLKTNRIYIGLSVALIVLYVISRLVNLTLLPIFTDEAIYLRWGQLGLGDAQFRLQSLVDGKQPLLIWLFLPAFKLFSDPLFAGRIVSGTAGFVTMTGFAVLAWYISRSVRTGLIAAFLYIVSPFFLLYDRLALYDSLLSVFSVWSLFLSIVLVRKLRLDVALILGMTIGGGLLTKSSAQFFIFLMPASLLLFDWSKKNRLQRLGKWVGLSLIAIGLALLMTVVMRLSPFYHIIAQKNLTFIYSFSEFFENPLRSVSGNLRGMTSWLVSYITIPVFVAMFFAIAWALRKNFHLTSYLLLWFIFPFITLAAFGRVIYPRFILFMIIPLFIILSWYTTHLWTKVSGRKMLFVSMLVLGFVLYFDAQLIVNPIKAPLPLADRQQFLNDWPSGFGVAESIVFFENQAKDKKIVVGTEGTFGLFPYAFELYLKDDANIEFRPYWPVSEVPPDLLKSAQKHPSYLVFKERQDIPDSWPLELVSEYQRGDGPTYLRVFKVIPRERS